MSAQLQVTLVFLALACISLVTGYFERGEPGYQSLQDKLVDGVNKQIPQMSASHAVNIQSYRAVEWDTAQREAVTDGAKFEKTTLDAICNQCPEHDKQPCRKAVREIWDMAKNGKSAGGSGVKGIYTKCSDLKTAVGTDSRFNNCA